MFFKFYMEDKQEYIEVLGARAHNLKNIDVKIRSKLWAVRHEWPSGEKFTFNCYRHWDTLVVRDTEDRSGHFLHIK